MLFIYIMGWVFISLILLSNLFIFIINIKGSFKNSYDEGFLFENKRKKELIFIFYILPLMLVFGFIIVVFDTLKLIKEEVF